jgi:hypothetical protein
MNVLVTGGRDFRDYAKVERVLDEVLGWSPTGKVRIVSGGATGGDDCAVRWAKERGQDHIEYPVARNPAERVAMGGNCYYDFETHGKGAGPLRNQLMLDREKPEQGVVLPGGNGTHDMLTRLWNAGVNTWVVGDRR